MEYVTLGKTGLKISRLGFGGIPIQRIDAAAAMELLEAVRAAGINYIDTARGYTVSEELIGQAIDGHRDQFILATKSMSRDRESMERDIGISLKNLRTDYIDLYQVHNPNLQQLDQVCAPGGALEALMEAKEQGKIRHLGLTAHSLEVFEKGLDLPWVETIMFPYNLVETQGEALMAKAAEKNIAVIAMKPLAGGAIEDATLALNTGKAAFSHQGELLSLLETLGLHHTGTCEGVKVYRELLAKHQVVVAVLYEIPVSQHHCPAVFRKQLQLLLEIGLILPLSSLYQRTGRKR